MVNGTNGREIVFFLLIRTEISLSLIFSRSLMNSVNLNLGTLKSLFED